MTISSASCTALRRLDLSEMHAALRPELDLLRTKFGELGELRPLGGPSAVADATTKAAVVDAAGKCVAVVICSAPESPGLVARGVANAEAAKQRLGEKLGSVILKPLAVGEVNGLGFVILPYRQPLAAWKLAWLVQRSWLVPRVLDWMHGVAAIGTSAHSGEPGFAAALLHCEKHPSLPADVRRDAGAALERLSGGQWRPRHTLDHNDLWKDNILLAPQAVQESEREFAFTIIDWVGANIVGFGVYDLVRLCRSMKVEGVWFDRELMRHCAALGCEKIDAMGHMLASLGWLGQNLEYFPLDRYVRLVELCWRTVKNAMKK